MHDEVNAIDHPLSEQLVSVDPDENSSSIVSPRKAGTTENNNGKRTLAPTPPAIVYAISLLI
jgi:hypothetical protein